MNSTERLLTLQEAEKLTGRKVSTWRRDLLERRITFVKIGRQVRIPLSVIEGLINKGIRPALENAISTKG